MLIVQDNKGSGIMKIMEWNINHRLGISNVDMPTWVAKEIKEKQKADITIITECCNRIPNWKNDFLDAFDKHTYLTFSSNNDQVGNNDVTILINKENINVISAYSFLAEGHSAPDHLQLNCRTKDTNKEFTIVGLRIHTMNISDIEKRKQFCLVLDNL